MEAGETTVAAVWEEAGASPEGELPRSQALAVGGAVPEPAPEAPPPSVPPPPPAEVRVELKALARTVLKVDGR